MVDPDENGGLPLTGQRGGRVLFPHLVGLVRGGGVVVGLGAMGAAAARRRQQAGPPHQPDHPGLAGADLLSLQLGPDLPLPVPQAEGSSSILCMRSVSCRSLRAVL